MNQRKRFATEKLVRVTRWLRGPKAGRRNALTTIFRPEYDINPFHNRERLTSVLSPSKMHGAWLGLVTRLGYRLLKTRIRIHETQPSAAKMLSSCRVILRLCGSQGKSKEHGDITRNHKVAKANSYNSLSNDKGVEINSRRKKVPSIRSA